MEFRYITRAFRLKSLVVRVAFCNTRKSISQKLQNPRLLRISFHAFRRWKTTSLCHQTKNILLVKEFLGHANLDNTLLYTQIEQAFFGAGSDDEFIANATNNKEEEIKLLSVGFEYVCEKDGMLHFGKRK
jgi:integrase